MAFVSVEVLRVFDFLRDNHLYRSSELVARIADIEDRTSRGTKQRPTIGTELLKRSRNFIGWISSPRVIIKLMVERLTGIAASQGSLDGLWAQLDMAGDLDRSPLVLTARNRVTVDLRGLGPRLQAFSAARGLSVSTVIRRAVLAQLEAASAGPHEVPHASVSDDRVVKLSVRLKHRHAALLADRAAAATLSRGTYVASLLDGMVPPAQSPEHREAVTALLESTQRLAVLSADLNAFLRLSAIKAWADPLVGLGELSTEVRDHLRTAARMVARLTRARSAVDREETASRT